jgi:hypothetical protein
VRYYEIINRDDGEKVLATRLRWRTHNKREETYDKAIHTTDADFEKYRKKAVRKLNC